MHKIKQCSYANVLSMSFKYQLLEQLANVVKNILKLKTNRKVFFAFHKSLQIILTFLNEKYFAKSSSIELITSCENIISRRYLTWPSYSSNVESMGVIDLKITLDYSSLLLAFAAYR